MPTRLYELSLYRRVSFYKLGILIQRHTKIGDGVFAIAIGDSRTFSQSINLNSVPFQRRKQLFRISACMVGIGTAFASGASFI